MPIDLDNDAGGERAPRIPDGEYVATIGKILTRGGQGGPLKTQAGDRKVRFIFAHMGNEAMYEAMVEGAAKWKMARLLKHAGYSSEALDEAGINEYADFVDQRTAERFLLNKPVRIKVSTRVDGGKEYADVETLPQAEPPKGAAKRAAPKPAEAVAPREDVPF